MGKDSGGGSPPPAPDYAAAARATAQGNLEAARASAAANRLNQYTPYGNLTYTQTPTQTLDTTKYNSAYQSWVDGGRKGAAPDQSNYMQFNPDAGWTATQTLSPAQQQILDSTNQLNQGLMSTANTGLQYANSVLSKPGVDTRQLPQVGINPGQSYQDAMMARLQPQIDRENQQSDAQLANQGITQGSTAYNNAKTLLNQSHNDLLNNATVQGFNTGLAANQNAFQQGAYNQMQPINVINALRTGSQVQNPNFVNVPQQATTAGPDLLGATNAQYQNQLSAYNAQQANSSNFLGGLMNMAGTIGAKYFTGSDRAIKQDVEFIGTHADTGLPIYSFQYKPEYRDIWGHGVCVGVMADDVEKVMPEAVILHPDGYKMVNYAMIGV